MFFKRKKSSKQDAEAKNTLYCSFCSRSQHEVRNLIAGPSAFICNDCVELCTDIIKGEHKTRLAEPWNEVLGPLLGGNKVKLEEIHAALSGAVPAPDHAIAVLARHLFEKAGYLKDKTVGFDPRTRPFLVLFRGPDLDRSEFMAKVSSLPIAPYVAVKASWLADMDSPANIGLYIFQDLMRKASGEPDLAQAGFVYVDDLGLVLRPRSKADDCNSRVRSKAMEILTEIVSLAELKAMSDGKNTQFDIRGMTFFLGGTFPCLNGLPRAQVVPPPAEKDAEAACTTPPPLTEAQRKALIEGGLDPHLVERVETVIDLNEE